MYTFKVCNCFHLLYQLDDSNLVPAGGDLVVESLQSAVRSGTYIICLVTDEG